MKSLRDKIHFFMSLPLSLRSIILNSAIVAFGSFMVTPFLGIFLKLSLKMDPPLIGVLMAISTFVQFGGGLPGAFVAERMGLKRAMVFSLSFRSLGFIFLGLSPTYRFLIFPAIVLVAAGAALYLPANRAYIISSVKADLKPLFLSISNASLCAGMAAGPLVAGLLIDREPTTLFFGVAGLFVVLAGIHQGTMRPETEAPRKTSFRGLPAAFQQAGRPVLFSVLTYYLYFFFQSFIGLYVMAVSNAKVFSWVMVINLVTLSLVQPLGARIISGFSLRHVLITGYLFFGTGLLFFTQEKPLWFFVGTFIMSLGQAVLFFRGDLEVVRRLPHSPALAFGIQRLSTGTGGFLTGTIGGFIYEFFQRGANLGSFWIFVAVNCCVASALAFISKDNSFPHDHKA